MRLFTILFLTLCTAVALAACVTAPSGGESTAVFKVNGREITAEELVTSPVMRQAIKQFLITDALMREAAKEGVTADEDAINDQIDRIEQDALTQGMTIDEYLKQQFVTVAEVKESIRMQQVFDKLVEARSEVTDAERDAFWEERGEEVKYSYARENHLTDAEAGELTREQVQGTLDEMILRDKQSEVRQTMMEQLINDINLEIMVINDQAEAERYEDLLINLAKTDVEEPALEQPEVEMPPAADSVGGGESVGGTPEAGADAEAEAEGETESGSPEEEVPAEDGGEEEGDGEAETQDETGSGEDEPEGDSGTEGQ